MNTSAVRLVQTRLAELGHYHDTIDGKRGPNTHAAVNAALATRSDDMPPGWRGWTDKRKSIGFLQLMCHDEDIDAGDIDGRWGPQTQFAFDALTEQRATGNPPVNFRDIVPGDVNPNNWPADAPDQQALTAFYGPHGVKDGFTPPQRLVDCPWRLRLSWDLATGTRRISCHEKVADSLSKVLTNVFQHYGEAEIIRLRLDIYGGCYNPRKKRRGSTWSTHSWGIALDFDPDNNQLDWGSGKATFARPDYHAWWNIWEAEGWLSLGRVKNFDWMHVQAAK
jgi:hypothetical protein